MAYSIQLNVDNDRVIDISINCPCIAPYERGWRFNNEYCNVDKYYI